MVKIKICGLRRLKDIEIVNKNDDVNYEDIDYLLSQLYDYCDGIGIWIDV